ncbi:hypothetical protein [Flavobacterium caeni]|uniref:Head domain of trimeric autotransporter adhesin n=1 Tax=Flavobacterium caeni TaxID=490189 RepID=A0A1G5GBA5_9FLAO|nr:hypothetical protein [Flavobacterium caeni]SCY48631.1 hypothetical protein SAMN02927903_01509 [Flavobacterium caeni]
MKTFFLAALILCGTAAFAQVGINTSTPNAALDVRSSNQAAPSNTDGLIIPKIDAFPAVNPTADQQGMMVYLTTSAAGKRPGFYYWDNSGAIWTPVSGDKGWEVTGNTGTTPTDDFVGTTDDQPLAFRTNNTEHMRITNTGSTGIGTATPQSKLHVANGSSGMTPNPFATATLEGGVSAYLNVLSTAETGVLFGSSGNATSGGIIYNSPGLPNSMLFRNNGNLTRMVLGPTGNLGLGNIVPQRPLQFDNVLGNKIGLWGNGTNHYGIGVQDYLLQFYTGGSGDDIAFGFGHSAGFFENMRIKGNGNIGMGTSAPQSKLHLSKGSSGMTPNPGSSVTLEDDAENYLSLLSGAESGILFGSNANSTNGAIVYNNPAVTDGMIFRTGGNISRMILTGTGEVSVGNFVPNARMHIGASNPAAPANNDGILIPRISAFPAVNPTAAHNGMMVYLASTAAGKLPGFYYWDNVATAWKGVGANSGWSMTGNAGTTPGTHFIGTTDDKDLVIKRNNVRIGQLGASNIALGSDALVNNTANHNNIAIGANTLEAAAPGNYSVAIGLNSLNKNTFSGSVGIGNNALENNVGGEYNIAVGTNALRLNSTGSLNTAVGFNALYNNATGWANTAFGSAALASNQGGIQNAGFGYNVLYHNEIGNHNSCFGNGAMYMNVSGEQNTAIGHDALRGNNSGDYNVAVGMNSYYTNTTGTSNTAIGKGAMFSHESGDNNVAVGMDAMVSQTSGSNNIAIGKGANVASLTGSNQLSVGNVIFGSDMQTAAAAKIGIGTSAPTAKLEVNGFTKLGSTAPAIKTMKLTGTTNSSQGSQTAALHGITSSKILSVSVLVEYTSGASVPPNYGGSIGYEYDYYISSTAIVVWTKSGNSAQVVGKPFRVLVTYEE